MITVLGSINLDLICKTSRLPSLGETVSGTEFFSAAGGKGANQALAACRAGARASLVAAVGEDSFASPATALLRESGVDMEAVRTRSGATGVGVVVVGPEGENMIVVVPGANSTISPQDAEEAVERMTPGDTLMLQLEVPLPTVVAALEACAKRGVRSILNVAPLTEGAAILAKNADVVIANEIEFEGLVGKVFRSSSEREIALLRMHKETGATVVVTLGADGVIGADKGELFRARGLSIDPVDTVGAGDTFCGYFAAALDQGKDLQTALERASVAGALACLKPGAQTAIPFVDAVEHHFV